MSDQMRNNLLTMLYRGTQTQQEFNWDRMTTVPILSLMTFDEVNYLRKIITSPRYSGNNKKKIKMIDEVMHNRGFTKFAGGTNRIVYTHPSAPNAVFKVALDMVGINDNPAEYYNQTFLKPYCCKVFECSPCGTIASFEKVDRITTFEEFYTIADDYFYLLDKIILGKYVMDDIGIDYFMNVGIRRGFGIVILDFPYMFELDGRKLECSFTLDDGSICSGEIDYDDGFNKLICKKCGKRFRAMDLAKPPESRSILLRENGGRKMVLEILSGDTVVKTYSTMPKRDYISKNEMKAQRKNKDSSHLVEIELLNAEPVKIPAVQEVPAVETEAKLIEKEPDVSYIDIDLSKQKTEKVEPEHYAIVDHSTPDKAIEVEFTEVDTSSEKVELIAHETSVVEDDADDEKKEEDTSSRKVDTLYDQIMRDIFLEKAATASGISGLYKVMETMNNFMESSTEKAKEEEATEEAVSSDPQSDEDATTAEEKPIDSEHIQPPVEEEKEEPTGLVEVESDEPSEEDSTDEEETSGKEGVDEEAFIEDDNIEEPMRWVFLDSVDGINIYDEGVIFFVSNDPVKIDAQYYSDIYMKMESTDLSIVNVKLFTPYYIKDGKIIKIDVKY